MEMKRMWEVRFSAASMKKYNQLDAIHEAIVVYEGDVLAGVGAIRRYIAGQLGRQRTLLHCIPRTVHPELYRHPQNVVPADARRYRH